MQTIHKISCFWHQLAIFCRSVTCILTNSFCFLLGSFDSSGLCCRRLFGENVRTRKIKVSGSVNEIRTKMIRITNFLNVEPNLIGVFLFFQCRYSLTQMSLDSKVNQHLPDLLYTYAITSCLIKN